MGRLPNKGTTQRAPQTGASVPELPDFSPQLAELPGGTETNAALQRWWDLVRQRIEFNNGDVNSRFSQITATFGNGINTLQAQITHEETVRADADSALATDIETVSATVDTLSASVVVIASALATVNDYLEARWTVNVTAGPIVTGMTLFSASGPDTEVSYVAFQANRFQVNTATGGNKLIFSGTGSEVKLGDVLTVDLANTKMFIGTGSFNNNNTPFYVDASGNFSLKSFLSFNAGTNTLSIATSAGSTGGWTINPTTLTGGNATLDSTGVLILGTSNDIVYISAVDTAYRLWVGNVTAASATFSVTKGGALFSTSGTIGGWTIGTTTISNNNAILDSAGQLILGTSNDVVYLSATDSTYRLWIGNVTAGSATFSVTKTGALVSTSGAIGGFSIGSSSLNSGSGSTYVEIQNSSSPFLKFGAGSNYVATYTQTGMAITGPTGIGSLAAFFGTSASNNYLIVYNNSSSPILTVDASSAVISLAAQSRHADGTSGAPSISFINDTDTGWLLNSAGDMRAYTSGAGRLVVRDSAIVCLVPLKIDNSRAAGAPVPGGTVTIQDSSGSTISLITT